MKQQRILIWSKSVSDFFDGNVCGIGVQLYFWAQTFTQNRWEVSTLTSHKSFRHENIHFIHYRNWGKLEFLHEWIAILWNIVQLHPQIVIHRGAGRITLPLAIISKCSGVKFVLFSASDTDFETGRELIAGGSHNRRMWHKAIKWLQYIIVQNQYQHDMLKNKYGKESLILNNVWGHVNITRKNNQTTDVVWVANFRRLKRAEWFVNAAKVMPEYDFTMIGGASKQDHGYYEEIKQQATSIPNLHFLGKKDFNETNSIVANSRLLCCTSTFEGFPNTFLQAWANNIPVISTVNPSSIISKNHLGIVVETEESFKLQIRKLLQDDGLYSSISQCINHYFSINYEMTVNYNKLVNFVNEKQDS